MKTDAFFESEERLKDAFSAQMAHCSGGNEKYFPLFCTGLFDAQVGLLGVRKNDDQFKLRMRKLRRLIFRRTVRALTSGRMKSRNS